MGVTLKLGELAADVDGGREAGIGSGQHLPGNLSACDNFRRMSRRSFPHSDFKASMFNPVVLSTEFRIVSGGQSGADRAALDWAIAHGVRYGGWCPKARRSEDGPIPDRYLLSETPKSDYRQRTEWNVRDSDATVIFTLTDELDGGSKLTAGYAQRLDKPWLHFRPGVHEKYLAQFLVRHKVAQLNVAGKRESSAPGIHGFVTETLNKLFVPHAAEGMRPSATASIS